MRQIATLMKKGRYDFDRLFNGKAWALVKGEDFTCEIPSARSFLYKEATTRGITIYTKVDGDEIHVQLVPDNKTPSRGNGQQ